MICGLTRFRSISSNGVPFRPGDSVMTMGSPRTRPLASPCAFGLAEDARGALASYGPACRVPAEHQVTLGVSSNGSIDRRARLRVYRSSHGVEALLHEVFVCDAAHDCVSLVLAATHHPWTLRLEGHTERWMRRDLLGGDMSHQHVCWEDDMNTDPDLWNVVVELRLVACS